MTFLRPTAAGIAAALLTSACSFAPPYRPPSTVAVPDSFKELPGWRVVAPSDAVAKGDWWELFDDPTLAALERGVIVSNQNLAAAKGAYDQARALVREDRAALFPTVEATGRGSDAGRFVHRGTKVQTGTTTGTTTTGTGTTGTGTTGTGTTGTSTTSTNGASTTTTTGSTSISNNALQLGIEASWAPDLWGEIGNTVRQAKAQAQASAADLANATLSAQGELALDYLQLRGVDAQKAALDATVGAYQRALTITSNLYDQGQSARSDVLQAQTALENAQGDDADLIRQRALLEHAIAVLVGENPSTFAIATQPWRRTVPDVPAVVPSSLLERRPDIAAAERRASAANAQIGVARAAFFPTVNLTGQAGQATNSLGSLFSVASSAWSFGLTSALTLLDFGARSARVSNARAAFDQAVATYRQTVLTAFQQTEDQLATIRVLATVADRRSAAAASANRAEAIARNQYGAGQIAYSSVIVTQTTALSARTADIAAVVNRQVAAVSLIQAIGGRWDARAGSSLSWRSPVNGRTFG